MPSISVTVTTPTPGRPHALCRCSGWSTTAWASRSWALPPPVRVSCWHAFARASS